VEKRLMQLHYIFTHGRYGNMLIFSEFSLKMRNCRFVFHGVSIVEGVYITVRLNHLTKENVLGSPFPSNFPHSYIFHFKSEQSTAII